ncbi:MAG: hypothetical protein LBF00_01775 [Mycoplasmataceae bacterium]|jgi:RNA polymerase subunit RPABC4/transcription elongation factor Spt4|nr:hypothetical protein [Mycoplasmataceae bacterium]
MERKIAVNMKYVLHEGREIMRYCPNCKKEVNTRLTAGQVDAMVICYLFYIIPGIIYSIAHARKCPICGSKTTKL